MTTPLPSYTNGVWDAPMLGDTIGDNFDRTVAAHADRDALVDRPSGRRWTYAELRRDVDAVAVGLLKRGIGKGDRVGIWAPNCPEWTLIQFATAKIGAVLVNINPAYRAHELRYVLDQAGIRLLVSAPEFKSSDYAGMIEEVRPQCPDLERVVLLGSAEWSRLASDGMAVHAADPSLLPAAQAALSSDDPINIQYTSGTTGFPKGATLSHHNILNNGYFVGELCHYTENDRVCIPVPFYHCFGMVIGNLNALSHGAATIIPGRSFTPAGALEAVQDFGGTSLYGVPTMFIAELALPDFASYDLSTLRTGVMAGSLCPIEVMNRVISEMNMKDVAICYGMTETSPVSTMTRDGDTMQHRTETVGRTMPQLESQVVDPVTGSVLERGDIGELCTRGYSVMQGYWDQPDKTAEAIDADGWMHTGDLARMDAEGYVVIEGRIKDMVIRGGENIYPREIEEFLYTHPSIQDVQVIGVPDAKYGEELMACIILKPGAEPLDAAAVAEFCRGQLAHYKIPRYVDVRESFPMTVSGKIRKVEMRKEAVARLGL